MNHKFNIENKNILFICRNYFGYDSEILSVLKKSNNVFHLIDVPYKSNFIKILIRFFPSLFFNRTNKIYERLIYKSDHGDFDYVFVIIGETVSPKFLKGIKENYPNAKLILYIWDSINNNRRNLISRFHLYDKIFCFQKEDAKKYNINFLPLFYIDTFKNNSKTLMNLEYDLCFVGTAHADRPMIVQDLLKEIGATRKVFTFLYLQTEWLYWIYKILYPPYRKVNKSILNFKKISKEEIFNIYKNCKIILDIQHPKQTGLTIRTFEVLASGAKLVTTNSDIISYDFYDENQICVIDRKTPTIPDIFFDTKSENNNPILIQNYSLNTWLNKIFKND